jgi:DNA recombination protein RmuC
VTGSPLVWLAAAAALALGLFLGWLLAGARLSAAQATARAESARRQEAEARLEGERRGKIEAERRQAIADERAARAREAIAEQKAFVEGARKELEDTFGSLAAAALRGSTEQFLALAEQRLQTGRTQAAADLEERKAGIDALLQPLRETLERLDRKTAEVERSRIDAYSRIDQQVQSLKEVTLQLHEKTTHLDAALRGGQQTRGRWGEIALRNIVELAGMSEHCDFVEQQGQEEGGRPDMIVRLPGDRRLAVDAKASLVAFLEASEATSDEVRSAALARHAAALRQHVRILERRDYPRALGGGLDFVILFLPGDPFLGAAMERDPGLQSDAIQRGVLIATPTTLVALLRNAALFWQQQSLADNAREIAATALLLYQRVAVFREHLEEMGNHLQGALEAFNRAVGSFQARLLPLAGRLEEMKVAEQEMRAVKDLRPVEGVPRVLSE